MAATRARTPIYMNAREVTPYYAQPHTYGSHLHIRRRKPEASRVLHFYSAHSFFSPPSPAAIPAFGSARELANERAHNQPPLPATLLSLSLRPRRALASLSLPETVFHIQNVFPARRGLLPDSQTPCFSRSTPRASRLLSEASWPYLWKEYKTWIVRGTAYVYVCQVRASAPALI